MNREGSGGLSDLKTNMQRVNTTVLKMINQKKYPLSSTKYRTLSLTKKSISTLNSILVRTSLLLIEYQWRAVGEECWIG